MKQVSVIISTYTADVSGVCSALYELGGMVVIHDPSGCNSTYNTHDEPRWYEQDSLVFISGLSEIDAIMGNDDKFIEDIIRAARDLSPRFIALVRTPVPWMIGTDFEAMQRILEKETGLPVFYFPTNGMHSYVQGAGMALAEVARRLVDDTSGKEMARDIPGEKRKTVPGKIEEETKKNDKADGAKQRKCPINLLGVTPLDFSMNSTVSSMIAFFENHGHPVISTFAMGSTPKQIARAGEAAVNVVVSSVGLPAAKVLQERFGTPYVVGMPVEPLANKLLADVEKSAQDGNSRIAYNDGISRVSYNINDEDSDNEKDKDKNDKEKRLRMKNPYFEQNGYEEETIHQETPVYFIGEAVTMESLAKSFRKRYGLQTEVICPLEVEEEGILTGIRVESEEEIREILTEAAAVIADPMYQPISPENTPFFSLPHEAFSGRIYRKQIPDLTDIRFLDEWVASNRKNDI
ncbi:MAG: nitrogenase component 1 [Clostridiales bacterium]|nr:nitrogenase component 1 [Clostridiales bacterium]